MCQTKQRCSARQAGSTVIGSEHAAYGRRRIGAANRAPQDVVQLIVVVQIVFAKSSRAERAAVDEFAGLRSSSEMRGFSA